MTCCSHSTSATPCSGDDHPFRTYMPSYEVTVTVIVEHDGKPIVYSRSYLPQYMYMPVASINIDQMRPANYVPEIFEQQMNRIRNIRSWVNRTLQSNGCGTKNLFGDPKVTWTNLIDGDANTKWNPVVKDKYHSLNDIHIRRSYWDQSQSGYYSDKRCFFAEFKTNFPVTPWSYTLTTANNNASNHAGRPRTWVLLGKKKASDPWTMLDAEETAGSGGVPRSNALPKGNLIEKEYFFNSTQPDGFQYFRFEVIDTWNDDDDAHMQLGEFRFNYNLPW